MLYLARNSRNCCFAFVAAVRDAKPSIRKNARSAGFSNWNTRQVTPCIWRRATEARGAD